MPRTRTIAYLILAAALLVVSLVGAQVTGTAWSVAATGPGGTIPTRTPTVTHTPTFTPTPMVTLYLPLIHRAN